MCVAYQVSQIFGPRHSNSSPHSSYPSALYIRERGEEGLVMWLVDVAKFRPPHFLVAVSTPDVSYTCYASATCYDPHAPMHASYTCYASATCYDPHAPMHASYTCYASATCYDPHAPMHASYTCYDPHQCPKSLSKG